ncbi:hypothetical protein PVK06_036498 [Gossypium arboreum]|uniref:Uncharacterized protein n=1 Tax=Gossypium arboreum TaxID=29729 RepID=A0ABR0NJQ8_GOSAR|nr:hypothetical protein PVK06_036498 [Gossypium arboreum]
MGARCKKHKHIMLSVFSSEPQNSTQILKLNVAVALHLGDTGLQLLKASPTVISLEICFELKMVVIYISLNEEANKDCRKPFSLYKFGHENDSFGKKYFNEGEIHCVEFKGHVFYKKITHEQ